MAKIITSIAIDQDIKEHIDQNTEIKSFSDWVAKKYTKEFMNLETSTKRLERLLRQIEKEKEQIAKIKKVNKTLIDTLPPEAKLWLKNEGKNRLRKFSEEGVYKYFLNKYNLWEKINRRQFKILLEMVENAA